LSKEDIMSATTGQNPYQFSLPVVGPHFFDREEILGTIFGELRKGSPFSLMGERRSGTTSLLLKIHDIIQSEDLWPDELPADPALLGVYLYGQDLHSPKEFYGQIIRSVQEQEPDLGLPWGDEPSHFASLLQSLNQRGRKPVLILDEFATILRSEAFAGEFGFLRSQITAARIILITATPKPIDDYFEPGRPESSPFFNVFHPEWVGPFDQESFDIFLARTAEPSGFPIEDCRKQVLDLGGRWPFFTQMVCWLYWDVWSKVGYLSVEDHTRVRGRFENQAEPHFKYLWRHLSPEEQDILAYLVKLPVEQQAMVLDVLTVLRATPAANLSRHPKPGIEELRVALASDDYASPEQRERALAAWSEFSPEMRRDLVVFTAPDKITNLTKRGYLLDGKQLFSSAFADFVLTVQRTKPAMHPARGEPEGTEEEPIGEPIIITEEDLRRYGLRP
jgi:hypothetical protein